MTLLEFTIERGITGAPALCAILKDPFLNGRSLPVRERVPSGKVQRWMFFCGRKQHKRMSGWHCIKGTIVAQVRGTDSVGKRAGTQWSRSPIFGLEEEGICCFNRKETYLEEGYPIFERLKLRSAIATVNSDISTKSNCCSQNWNLTELLFGNEFIVPPAHGCTQKWNIHPRTVVGDK